MRFTPAAGGGRSLVTSISDRVRITGAGIASRTAMITACARGVHLLAYGRGALLSDWLAWPLVGGEAETLSTQLRAAFGEAAGPLATSIAARSRVSEDWLEISGAEQYVIMGAGLDSFAWRQPAGVRVLEIDHPATQTWKRTRLEKLAIPLPPSLMWVPVDFEVESVALGLGRANLRPDEVFISWLGVAMYLSTEAIGETLRGLPRCSLAVSYCQPTELLGGASREASETFCSLAAESSEAVISLFTAADFAEILEANGFTVLEDIGAEEIEARYGLATLSFERIALATNAGAL